MRNVGNKFAAALFKQSSVGDVLNNDKITCFSDVIIENVEADVGDKLCARLLFYGVFGNVDISRDIKFY